MSNYSDSSYSNDPNSSWYKIFHLIDEGSTLLDIGCSSGNFGKVLKAKKNCIVDGIELDEADYKLAKKNLKNVYNLNIETDDLGEINEVYDYIYFGDVIEHLVTPAKTLRRIHHLLKPGGKLLFSIPNMAHVSVRLMLLKGDFVYGETGLLDKTHLHFYNTKEVERILKEAGYELVHFDPVLKDFPKELMQKELNKVGLNLTDEFLEYTRTSEASIYQMVGAAQVKKDARNSVQAKLPSSSPVDIFQHLLDETIKHYEEQIKEQQEHIKKLESYAKRTVRQYEQTQTLLAEKDAELMRYKNGIVRRVGGKIKRSIDR